MRKYSFLILLTFVAFFCCAFSEGSYDYKFKTEYQTSAGAVTFDHEVHSMDRLNDCHACHSALKAFGGSMTKLLAHNYCQNCHESSKGPTECNGCHHQKKVASK